MEANKILQADILDLLFDGRNKEYGAYELRKKYNRRIMLALGITAIVIVAAVGSSVLAQQLKPNGNGQLKISEVVIENIKPPEEEKPIPPQPKPETPPLPKVETVKLTTPVIKKDAEVEQEEMPPISDLEDKKVGIENQDGIKDLDIAVLPPPVDEKKVVEEPKEDPEHIYISVEIPAQVDQKQWFRHLQSKLQPYIDDAADNGMASGTYTVEVRFLVEKDGSITDVHSLNDPGFGLARAAVDVLKKGPRWTAGIQNGKPVRSYHKQQITFMVQE